MLAQLFDSSLYTSSGRLLLIPRHSIAYIFFSELHQLFIQQPIILLLSHERKKNNPYNKKRNGEQNEKLNSPKKEKSWWTRLPSTADWIENYVGGLERDGGAQQGVENSAVMMSKSTTGASQPSRRVLPSFRTRDRWSLAASPCSYSLLLLATVVVVQLYNFSTVASSKRV